jgi:hypothetical protein
MHGDHGRNQHMTDDGFPLGAIVRLHALRREINEAFRANAPVAFPGERVACFPAKTKYFVQLVEPP